MICAFLPNNASAKLSSTNCGDSSDHVGTVCLPACPSSPLASVSTCTHMHTHMHTTHAHTHTHAHTCTQHMHTHIHYTHWHLVGNVLYIGVHRTKYYTELTCDVQNSVECQLLTKYCILCTCLVCVIVLVLFHNLDGALRVFVFPNHNALMQD